MNGLRPRSQWPWARAWVLQPSSLETDAAVQETKLLPPSIRDQARCVSRSLELLFTLNRRGRGHESIAELSWRNPATCAMLLLCMTVREIASPVPLGCSSSTVLGA